jgi:hypothetical protein
MKKLSKKISKELEKLNYETFGVEGEENKKLLKEAIQKYTLDKIEEIYEALPEVYYMKDRKDKIHAVSIAKDVHRLFC